MLIQNLDRLNDNVREESDGIHNSLSIIENLVSPPSTLIWFLSLLKKTLVRHPKSVHQTLPDQFHLERFEMYGCIEL